ncbi:hypothetical protein RFY41_00635 [Acinetobacter soli]|uniref:hypothetical protein n=1 Tax=Acinetobacter soli TaxID=487316 RepID=UPI0028134FB8|nr:hypothetical protein [Acinetobacter soli]MDQ9831567.1 hypothetical protein [Acinetobacter soli]
MSNLNIKITTTKGRTYQIEQKQYEKLEKLITYSKDEMTKPCIYHMLSWISHPDSFKISKRDLIKLFNRRLRKQYKKLKQEVPNTLVAYSIEFKYTDVDEINGVCDHPTTGTQQLPFLHLHFYVIADCNKCNPVTFTNFAKAALNEIDGLSKSRYFKSNKGESYKNVKEHFDDSFQRLLYIGKITQKSPEIPYRETFGASRV